MQILNALLDDLNTPQSIYEMHQLFNNEKFDDLSNACRFFGFSSEDIKDGVSIPPDIYEKIDKLVKKRNNARMAKNFSLADEIREDLLRAGIIIKDSGQETTWESGQKLEIKKLKKL